MLKVIRGSRSTPKYPKGYAYFVINGKIIEKMNCEELFGHICQCEDIFDQM